MKNIIIGSLVVLVVIFWIYFAVGADPLTGYYHEGNLANFFSGIWHGWWIVINFIRSLFNPDIGVYEVVNTGGWYDFGFVLGVGALGKSSSSSNSNNK